MRRLRWQSTVPATVSVNLSKLFGAEILCNKSAGITADAAEEGEKCKCHGAACGGNGIYAMAPKKHTVGKSITVVGSCDDQRTPMHNTAA